MKSVIAIIALAFIASNEASLFGYVNIHEVPSILQPGVIIKGPSTKTIVAGPDGAVIKSFQEGAEIVTGPQHAPAVISHIPAAIIPHIPVVVAPAATGSAVIAGPSGTIITGGAVAPHLPVVSNGYTTKYIDGKPILGPLVTPGLGWFKTHPW